MSKKRASKTDQSSRGEQINFTYLENIMTNEKIEQAIASAAFKARQQMWAEFGESHDLEKLKKAYRDWLENAIENLLEECLPMAAGGTNKHELFAYSFHNAIAQLKPNHTVEDEHDQYIFDQILAA